MKVSYLNDDFFSRLETCALNLRTDLTGFFGGKHLVKTYGQTVEFADYREYMLGDDIRRIDWNLFSRFEKFFLKLFTDERQMHTQIYIDCSASMGKPNANRRRTRSALPRLWVSFPCIIWTSSPTALSAAAAVPTRSV